MMETFLGLNALFATLADYLTRMDFIVLDELGYLVKVFIRSDLILGLLPALQAKPDTK